jgi:hypothetical protein
MRRFGRAERDAERRAKTVPARDRAEVQPNHIGPWIDMVRRNPAFNSVLPDQTQLGTDDIDPWIEPVGILLDTVGISPAKIGPWTDFVDIRLILSRPWLVELGACPDALGPWLDSVGIRLDALGIPPHRRRSMDRFGQYAARRDGLRVCVSSLAAALPGAPVAITFVTPLISPDSSPTPTGR